jgi:transcriptional regulator with XRE-family HTH domain
VVALRNIFARNLRASRLAAGLSQRELAELSGLSREFINGIETAARNCSLDVVDAVAKHLGQTPLDLLTPPAQHKREL